MGFTIYPPCSGWTCQGTCMLYQDDTTSWTRMWWRRGGGRTGSPSGSCVIFCSCRISAKKVTSANINTVASIYCFYLIKATATCSWDIGIHTVQINFTMMYDRVKSISSSFILDIFLWKKDILAFLSWSLLLQMQSLQIIGNPVV